MHVLATLGTEKQHEHVTNYSRNLTKTASGENLECEVPFTESQLNFDPITLSQLRASPPVIYISPAYMSLTTYLSDYEILYIVKT